MAKKILFFITPATSFQQARFSLREAVSEYIPQPLGMAYLGGMLREKGYQVEIYDPHIEHYEAYSQSRDVNLLKTRISQKINNTDFDVLGISSLFIYTYEWAHFMANVAKTKHPNLPVVIGGGYPSLLFNRVLQDDNIDYAVIGEGEISFLRLLNYFDTLRVEDLEEIDGIGYKRNGSVVIKPKKTYITDVDNISFPAWDMVNVEKYMQFRNKRSLIAITSRGCPYSCTFCNSYKTWGRLFRKRSAANVLAEMDYLIDRFGVEDILFVDDNMTIGKKRFMEIAEGLKERDITWGIVNISSFTTDEEMLWVMKESGCHEVTIAVESAVPETLKAIRKPVDLQKTKDLVKMCRDIGLQCRLCYITGLPHETKEDMLRTFEYSAEVRGDWNQYSTLVPYPGTDIYAYCEQENYLVDNNLNLAEFTQRKIHVETEHWSKEWVADTTYDYNIKTNFLRNYNLTETDGKLEAALEHFAHVSRFNSKHVIAVICLAYAHHKNGDSARVEELLGRASELLTDQEVQETYGKYLAWDEEVIDFYKSWANSTIDAPVEL